MDLVMQVRLDRRSLVWAISGILRIERKAQLL